MANEDEIDIKAKLTDAVSGPAQRAENALENLDDQIVQTAASMEALEHQAEQAGDELEELARDAKKAERALKQQARAQKQSRDEMGRFTEGTKKGRFQLKSFLKVGFGFGKFFKVAKIFAIADGINFLATGITGLGAAGVAGVAGLAPLTGMLVAYPGLIAAAAQGIGVLKLGFSGLGSAISVLADPKADPKAIAEALKDLTPNARKLAVEIAGLRGEGVKLKQTIQQKLLGGFDQEVKTLAKNYLPILNRQLGDTATSLNSVGLYTGRWLRQKSTMQAVNSVMDAQDVMVRNLAFGVSDLARSFIFTLKAASPMMKMLTGDFRKGMSWLNTAAEKNQAKLGAFFTNSYELAKDVAAVLKDLFVGIFNVGKASLGLANAMGGGVKEIAQNFRAWTESSEGQAKMREFFTFMKPVIFEIAKLTWALVQAFGQLSMSPNFVSTMQSIRKDILPSIVSFVQASDGQFIPSILRIIESIASLAANLHILGPIATIIRVLADGLAWFAAQVAGMSAGQQQFVGWVLTLGLFVKMGFPVLMFVKQFVPAGMTLSKVLSLIGKGLLFVGRALIALVVANPIVAVIVLVIGLLVLMYYKFEWFRNFVNAVWKGIATVAIAVWNWIKMAAQQFWSWIAPYVMVYIGLIGAYFRLLVSWWKLVWAVISLVATVVWVIIKGAVSTAISVIGGYFRLLVGFWKAVWSLIAPIVKPILDTIGKGIKLFVTGVKMAIDPIKSAFSAVFNGVKAVVMPIINTIKSAIEGITGAIDKVTSGVNAVKNKVGGIDLNPFNNNRFAGGDIKPGVGYTVGELGPEALVSRSGNVKMIGMNGPEFMKGTGDGYVVPNHVLAGADASASGVPSWATNALRRSAASQMPEAAPRTAHRGGQSTATMEEVVPQVHFNNNTFGSDVDVKKAIKQAWREHKLERERK